MAIDLPNVLGQYELVRPLARGGMAELAIARRLDGVGGEVVLKCLRVPRKDDPQRRRVRMFLDEARVTTLIDHTNVVKVFEVDYQEGIYFLVMEQLRGWNLAKIVRQSDRQKRPLPIPLVVSLVAMAARGLDAAHRCVTPRGEPLNLVHRDVSPSNLFVTEAGVLKVLDFGVAKSAIQLSETQVGFIKGKVTYMSPEQAHGRRLDRRSDIFSLGVVLHELLTSQRLFHREKAVDALHAVVEAVIPLPIRPDGSVSEDLLMAVMRALQRDCDLRFASAVEFAEALERAVPESRHTNASAVAEFLGQLFTGDADATPTAAPPQASQEALSAWGDTLAEQIRPLPDALGPSAETTFVGLSAKAEARDTQPMDPPTTLASRSLTVLSGDTPSIPEPTVTAVDHPWARWSTRSIVAASATLLVVVGLTVFVAARRPLPEPPIVAPTPLMATPTNGNDLAVPRRDDRRETQPDPITPSVTSSPSRPSDGPARSETRPSVSERQARAAKEKTARRAETESQGGSRPAHASRATRSENGQGRNSAQQQTPALGRLTLDATPWANVYLGKKLLGPTPLVEIELPAGRQTLRLENPETGAARVIVLDIPPGSLARHAVRFE